MEKEKTSLTSIVQTSALLELAKVPSFDSHDISLVMSHNDALELAEQILGELKEPERRYAFNKLFAIFEGWKQEHGIYPPPNPLAQTKAHLSSRLSFAASLSSALLKSENEIEKMPVKEQKLQETLHGQDLQGRLPWECDYYVRTPYRLFIKLRAENYPPINDYTTEVRYDFIYATLIIMTHRQGEMYQSGDCIKCAFELFRLRMSIQKSQFEKILPLAEKEFNRRRAVRLNKQAQKDETKQNVRREYIALCSQKDGPPKGLQSVIAQRVGIKQPQVSKILKELELETKQLDSFIDDLNKNIPHSSRNK